MVNTNLVYLNRQVETFSSEERDRISYYLIGWFSSLIGTEEWKQAVDSAIESAMTARSVHR